jgi:hypothetical protein
MWIAYALVSSLIEVKEAGAESGVGFVVRGGQHLYVYAFINCHAIQVGDIHGAEP